MWQLESVGRKVRMNANFPFINILCIFVLYSTYNTDACVYELGFRMVKSKVNVIHCLMIMVFIVDIL